jgi:hypothetical protein
MCVTKMELSGDGKMKVASLAVPSPKQQDTVNRSRRLRPTGPPFARIPYQTG